MVQYNPAISQGEEELFDKRYEKWLIEIQLKNLFHEKARHLTLLDKLDNEIRQLQAKYRALYK